LTEYRLELSSFLGLLFGLLTIIGIVGAYLSMNENNSLPSYISFLQDLSDPFGRWVAWIVVVAPIGLIVCAWWYYDYVKKIRELAELIDTPSKAKFVRNLDDIEYLAWSLPQRYEDKVLTKKKDFKI
jgi:H+/Cl- antiporter ClcA